MLYAFSHVDILINVHKPTYIMYMGDDVSASYNVFLLKCMLMIIVESHSQCDSNEYPSHAPSNYGCIEENYRHNLLSHGSNCGNDETFLTFCVLR